jgi:hypothetical protein
VGWFFLLNFVVLILHLGLLPPPPPPPPTPCCHTHPTHSVCLLSTLPKAEDPGCSVNATPAHAATWLLLAFLVMQGHQSRPPCTAAMPALNRASHHSLLCPPHVLMSPTNATSQSYAQPATGPPCIHTCRPSRSEDWRKQHVTKTISCCAARGRIACQQKPCSTGCQHISSLKILACLTAAGWLPTTL